MATTDFEKWLAKGLGRPFMWLRDHDPREYREAIFHACLHDLTYDQQSEDGRGQYLYELVQLSGEPDLCRDALLAALAEPQDDHDLYQVFDIVRYFARSGDQEARTRMYTAYARGADSGDFTGGDDLVWLDGLEGLLFAAEPYGRQVEGDDDWRFDHWIFVLADRDGEDRAWEQVDAASGRDPAFARLVEGSRRSRREVEAIHKGRRPAPPSSVDELYRILADSDPRLVRSQMWRWGRHADDAALGIAADLLLRETDPERQFVLVNAFQRRAFPRDPAKLIGLAHEVNADMRRAAIQALRHVTRPSVRAFAMELIAEPDRAVDGVALLRANYEDGDYALVEQVWPHGYDADIVHRFGSCVLDLVEAHPQVVAAPLMMRLYEEGPCSHCRRSSVRWLIDRGALPDWVRAECRYDAAAGTRELVGGE